MLWAVTLEPTYTAERCGRYQGPVEHGLRVAIMAPIQTNQRTGRALKWNRSWQLVGKPTAWTRDNSVFEEDTRSARSKRGVEGRRSASVGIAGERSVRRQSTDDSDIESDAGNSSGESVAESDDELDDNASDSDNESDGGISDVEDGDDDLGSDDGVPPAPVLTLNPPGEGVRTVPVPTDTAIPATPTTPEDIIVVTPTDSPGQPLITMTAIVRRADY